MFRALIARLGVERRLVTPLLALTLVPGIYGLVLKTERIVLYPGNLPWYQRALLLLPDLAFAIGFALSCATLAAIATRVRLPRAALVVIQCLALFVALFLTIAHGFFLASGQTLDYPMFAFSLGRASETAGVVASEAHWPLATALVLVPLLLLVGPWWLWRRASRASATPVITAATQTTTHWLPVLACALLSVASFCATYPPKLRGVERAFARDPISYCVVGAYQALQPRDHYRGKPTRLRKLGAASIKPRAASEPRKNLVVILLESTRWNATTPYNPKLKSTPFLDRLARESVRVERAYAVVPHTSKALVTIFCGYEPEMTLSVIESQSSALPGRCLPELLASQGYETVFFQAPTGKFEQRGVLVKNLGFGRFRSGDDAGPKAGLQRVNYFGYEDAVMLDPNEKWLAKRRQDKPFFAAYLTSASHHPYGAPRKHRTLKLDDDKIKNRYLNAVHYVDSVVGRIIDQYKKHGLYDNTVFVVLGDHGEAFGEHGLQTHDDVMFEEGIRIPLIMRLPNAQHAGTRIPGPVNELSIVPTLLDVLGFSQGEGGYEAASWFERGSEPALYASCYRADHCAAVMHGNEKLIYYFDERDPSFYDLSTDPEELDDIADKRAAKVEAMTKELLDVRLAVHETYRGANQRALQTYVSSVEPVVQTKLKARLGDYLELIGYRLPSTQLLSAFGRRMFTRFEMDYYFRVLEAPPEGYRLRNELRADRRVTMAYHVPVKGMLPLTDMIPGQYVDDRYNVHMPGDWASPTMQICLGLVNEDDVPVPVHGAGLEGKTCVPITTLPTAR